MNCHKPEGGCLLYKSLEQPKGNSRMVNKSIDSYADHAPKIEWIQSFFKLGDDFVKENSLGSVMIEKFRRFLKDAELLDKNKMTDTAKILQKIGLSNSFFWGVILVNLSHTPEIGWYVNNIPFDEQINRDELINKLKIAGAKDRGAKSITGAYKRILALPFGTELGLGSVIMNGKTYEGIIRNHWENPDPRVILYSLYKFAEKCGDYHQFSLTTLLDDSIEREGVSPTRIFGLNRETMIPLLNGLSANYPSFINARFTLGLDTITLREDKKSEDVLNLF
jgi:phosphoadenosine phosphosulfate reductase